MKNCTCKRKVSVKETEGHPVQYGFSSWFHYKIQTKKELNLGFSEDPPAQAQLWARLAGVGHRIFQKPTDVRVQTAPRLCRGWKGDFL